MWRRARPRADHRSQRRPCINEKEARSNRRKVSFLGDQVALLVVGSVAYDGIESPYGRVERTLGGAATYFAVSASFFSTVHLVGIVGDDFTDTDAAIFRDKKIDCEGLVRTAGKTFFWAGKYSENLNDRTTLTTELNVFAEFKPKLPEKYRESKYVFLAN